MIVHNLVVLLVPFGTFSAEDLLTATVVLVHGAFADSSSWNGEIERLRAAGHRVIAAANPLRGVAEDAAYVRSLLDRIEGPIVLAGHSYGGSVISAAATGCGRWSPSRDSSRTRAKAWANWPESSPAAPSERRWSRSPCRTA
ncbi:Alpha/beta hydrolase family protein [Amycolatopsis rubida]|uniref:Alpha/beta hydrolase family protein n=1 Tax=Amycolatopsis rubida TaxID=112413 RepID=A0A1I5NP52_9PSEU|nr:Alpha/beta hydrolase family protein [Amycolatopsis rubida]